MATKQKLHPRNKHSEGYDFVRLVSDTPELDAFTISNPVGQTTIDFQNVLDAERTATRVEDSYAVSQGLLAQAYIALYSALGGGYPDDEVELNRSK